MIVSNQSSQHSGKAQVQWVLPVRADVIWEPEIKSNKVVRVVC